MTVIATVPMRVRVLLAVGEREPHEIATVDVDLSVHAVPSPIDDHDVETVEMLDEGWQARLGAALQALGQEMQGEGASESLRPDA